VSSISSHCLKKLRPPPTGDRAADPTAGIYLTGFGEDDGAPQEARCRPKNGTRPRNALRKEFRDATGRSAESMEEAERLFAGLPLADRDRVGRRLNDPAVIGGYPQTPRTH
jgi:hypothetical protein